MSVRELTTWAAGDGLQRDKVKVLREDLDALIVDHETLEKDRDSYKQIAITNGQHALVQAGNAEFAESVAMATAFELERERIDAGYLRAALADSNKMLARVAAELHEPGAERSLLDMTARRHTTYAAQLTKENLKLATERDDARDDLERTVRQRDEGFAELNEAIKEALAERDSARKDLADAEQDRDRAELQRDEAKELADNSRNLWIEETARAAKESKRDAASIEALQKDRDTLRRSIRRAQERLGGFVVAAVFEDLP